MRRPLTSLIVIACCVTLAMGLVQARERHVPDRYLPGGLDRDLAQVEDTVGNRSWSAWSYRDGAEFDIALSTTDVDGLWTEPVFFGRDDGRDQMNPALAADSSGNVYLVYEDRTTGQVLYSQLAESSRSWSRPIALSALDERARAPELRIIDDRLVVAYWAPPGGVVILERPLAQPPQQLNFTDGPDPIGDKAEEPETQEEGPDDPVVTGDFGRPN